MAAVELLSAALAAEDVTEKTQKLDELKQQLDADADGAIAATLDAELPALVGLLSGEAAEPALGRRRISRSCFVASCSPSIENRFGTWPYSKKPSFL